MYIKDKFSDVATYTDKSGIQHRTPQKAKALSDIHDELKKPAAQRHEEANAIFRPSGDRGFHNADIHKAAEELRMEHKGSCDPMYPNSKKNK